MAGSGVTIDNPHMRAKPRLSFWQIWNMSFGFLGIQYGFGLQQANMSPIYRYLGADEASIPGLWLAGPLTGLLLQPIIGAVSDRSSSPTWGRRKPFILVGALLGSIAMVLMLAASYLPFIVPFDVTLDAAAAPRSSQTFMFWGAGLFVLPFIVFYTYVAYSVFRGKASSVHAYH